LGGFHVSCSKNPGAKAVLLYNISLRSLQLDKITCSSNSTRDTSSLNFA
jgi:hypothetical protein